MAQHAFRFLKLVGEAKDRIREVAVQVLGRSEGLA